MSFSILDQINKFLIGTQIGCNMLGLLGNTFMLVVYSAKNMRKISISTYFCAIAVVNLLFHVLRIIGISSFFGYEIISSSELSCNLFLYLTYLTASSSAWLDTAAGFDRLLVILYPTRFMFLRKLRIQALIISTIIVANIGIYLHTAFKNKLFVLYSKNETLHYICGFKDKSASVSVMFTDFFTASIVPFLLMAISSTVTFRGVLKSRNRIKTSLQTDQSINLRDLKFGVTIISLNILFVVMTAPTLILTVFFQNPYGVGQNTFMMLNRISSLFHDLFFAISFLVQVAVNSHVRGELLRLMGRGLNKVGISQKTTANSFVN